MAVCGMWELGMGEWKSGVFFDYFAFLKVHLKRTKKKKESQVTSKYVLYALYRRR